MSLCPLICKYYKKTVKFLRLNKALKQRIKCSIMQKATTLLTDC